MSRPPAGDKIIEYEDRLLAHFNQPAKYDAMGFTRALRSIMEECMNDHVRALRNLLASAHTLSPQEVANVAAGALGVPRPTGLEESSAMELRRERDAYKSEAASHLAALQKLDELRPYSARPAVPDKEGT